VGSLQENVNAATGASPRLDQEDFVRATYPFRRELLAHCLRLMGSLDEAEDQVQETYLRAWRSYSTFEGRSSLRTWLYRIATNACLTALESRGRLPLPTGFADRKDQEDTSAWMRWNDGAPGAPNGTSTEAEHADPATIVASREHRKRALLVAWDQLSPRQRAVLILHDVLAWQALEIADLLGTSGTAVHSTLSRARARLAQGGPAEAGAKVAHPGDAARQRLLDDYAVAFEIGDISALVRLLTDDALCKRNPSETVMVGREDIRRFLAHCPAIGECRMVPISINGKPGFGVYRADADGVYRAYTIDILTVTAAGIQGIEVLEDRSLFAVFGLAPVHRTDPEPAGTPRPGRGRASRASSDGESLRL
jgi:RNA polymerase sigma-70 factor (ECF subfamily)